MARGTGPAHFAVATAMAVATVATWVLTPRREDVTPPVSLTRATEYVSSNACRSCHPSEYASWHDSYHRTMTQAAEARTVLAPLERPVSLTLDHQHYELCRRGDGVWATVPEGERRVLMTTGSHHYQAYWIEGERPGALEMFPFVYLLGEEAGWLPRRDAFVEPPEAESPPARWESNCIQCHATAGRPGRSATRSGSGSGVEVAELGIACEACHGPGAAHVEKYRDPIERYAAHATDRADTTLVNPSRLDAERASTICGTCHAFTFPRDEEEFWTYGYTRSFRPGQDLDVARILLTADGLRSPAKDAPTVDTDADNLFYDEGTVRIGGREYNGMILSACFVRGDGKRKVSCLSCHSMHDSDPDDQLARFTRGSAPEPPGYEGDGACAACHDRARYAGRSHTHHAEGSPGGTCVGCHMPKTAYALLKSIRSHRIDSPDARSLGTSDRPNACNLCHLDRSLGWTSSLLVEWYGQHAPSEDLEAKIPAGAAWLLAGDPAQRSLAAAAMAEPGALRAVGEHFEAPLLAAAMHDPYAAVRFIAARSLRQLPHEDATGRSDDPTLVDTLVAARSSRALTLSE